MLPFFALNNLSGSSVTTIDDVTAQQIIDATTANVLAALTAGVRVKSIDNATIGATTFITTGVNAIVTSVPITAADVWTYVDRGLTDKTGYRIDLTQTGFTPRNLKGVADAALTLGDALLAGVVEMAGIEPAIVAGAYIKKTPAGTVVRDFTVTYDTNGYPTSRT